MESLTNTISGRRNPRKDFTCQCFHMKLLWMYSLCNFAICSMRFHVQHVYLHSICNTKILKCTFGITAIARHHSPGFTCQTKRLLHKSPSSLNVAVSSETGSTDLSSSGLRATLSRFGRNSNSFREWDWRLICWVKASCAMNRALCLSERFMPPS